jgi:hypothetical protein
VIQERGDLIIEEISGSFSNVLWLAAGTIGGGIDGV